jgi:hypothetical protein
MSTLDDLLEGMKRKASLGDLGESTADFLSEDKNTFGRKDAPEGIPAHYIDSDKEGNTYAGRSVGQSASRDPYEEAKKRSPVATGIGDMAGSAAAQVPAFLATSGMSLPARLMRNFAVPAAEHAISDEQGGLGDKLKGTAKWIGEHPVQQIVNTLMPEALPHVVKGIKANIGKLLGRSPTDPGPSGGGVDPAEVDDIMKEIGDYESTHGAQETPEAKAALVKKIMDRRIAANDNADVDLPQIGKPDRANIANDNVNIGMPQVPREQRVKRAANDDADRARIQGETAEEIIGSFFDHIKKMPMFQPRTPKTQGILNEMNETGKLPRKESLPELARDAYPDNLGIKKRTRLALNEEPVNTQKDHMGAYEMGKQRSAEASDAFDKATTHEERMSALDQQRDAYDLPKREPTGDDDVSNMIRELRGKEAAEKADWEAKWREKNLLDPEDK